MSGMADRGSHDVLAQRVQPALARLASCHVLCVGDVMLDVEVECGAGRISPEAPVLVFQEGAHHSRPGGAANVAANVAALGATTRLAAITGRDEDATTLSAALSALNVQCLFLAEPQGRPTTRKTRFIAEGQQLLRIDHEFMDPISEREADAILALTGATPASAILVSDYGKGMITSGMMRRLHGLAREQHAPLLVDPKGTDWQRYGPVDLIKPNAVELAVFAGLPCDSDAQVELALRHALNRSEAAAILVTRAAKGASLLHRDAETAIHFPAREVEVADVCGAGDTNLATLGAMLATGCALPDAVVMAQLASSLAVQRHGNAVITAAELAAEVQPAEASAIDGGVVDEAALAALMRGWRAQGLRVGFTNGCFDILHAGHLRSLEAARSRCDRLVVGLNSDASVRRLKGATRPIVGQRDRAELIAGLGAVDAVVLFDEDTPERLIGSVRPDVLCKGGDYAPGSIVGADLVSSYGGEVVVCDLLPGTSTTSIIDTIRRRFAREAAASIA